MKRFTNSVAKSQLVENMIGSELLFELGFSYEENKNVKIWSFIRKKGDVSQVIEVGPDVETIACNYVNIRIFTSIKILPIELSYIIDAMENIPQGHRFQEPFLGWAYTDKKSFISLMELFKMLIVSYALPELECRSIIKEDVYITTECFHYMKDGLSAIVQQYNLEWGLLEKNLEDRLRILSEQIIKYKGKPFLTINKDLANIAAVYGNTIIQELGGEWKWNDFSNNILIDKVSNTHTFVRPMHSVFEAWRETETLISDYKRIQEEAANSRPYSKHKKIRRLFEQ